MDPRDTLVPTPFHLVFEENCQDIWLTPKPFAAGTPPGNLGSATVMALLRFSHRML